VIPPLKRIGTPRVIFTDGHREYCVETVEVGGNKYQRFKRWFVREIGARHADI
jgi:hypothetical protein